VTIRHLEIWRNQEILWKENNATASEFLDLAYRHLEIAYSKFHKMDRLSKLGFLASEFLLEGHPRIRKYPPGQVGVLMANSNSSLDTDLEYFRTVQTMASPALFVYTLPNIVIGEICIRNGFKGENAFFVFHSLDATFMHQYLEDLFSRGLLDACLCGWVDILDEAYSATLILVERESDSVAVPMTAAHLNKIFGDAHG